MDLGLKINKIPIALGQQLAPETLDAAAFRRAGFLRRLLSRRPVAQDVYAIDNCELKGLNDELHIYPCTHSYLNDDRQWRTRVTLYLKQERLQRVFFQVVDGKTAAQNFLERFETAAAKLIGEPHSQDRFSSCWRSGRAHVKTYLHPNRVDADFVIELRD